MQEVSGFHQAHNYICSLRFFTSLSELGSGEANEPAIPLRPFLLFRAISLKLTFDLYNLVNKVVCQNDLPSNCLGVLNKMSGNK